MPKKKKAVDNTLELKKRKERLAIWSGVIAGLVFSITLWGNEALSLMSAHAADPFARLAMGILPVTALCTFVAWYANRLARAGLSILLWLGAGGLIALFAGHLPFEGLTLFYSLFDPQIAAKVSLPFNAAISTRVLSLVVIVALLAGVSGILFRRMLENASSNTRRSGAVLTMLVWSIFFFGSAWIIHQTLQMPFLRPVEVVNSLVQAKLGNDATPLSADQAAAANMAAIDPVAGLVSEPYRLALMGYDDLVNQTSVLADFSGGWAQCSVLVDRSSGSAVLKAGACVRLAQ